MTLKHHNPTQPRPGNRWARAPYNFVPLAEQIVLAKPPPAHDKYHADHLTGWIDCALLTCSPTYVRGMLTNAEFQDFGDKGSDQLTDEQKRARAPFFSTTNQKEGKYNLPSIPGSSLRGMTRALIEIIAHGRIRYIADTPTFSFRAVASPKTDPLTEPYRVQIGAFGKNIKVGYLERDNDRWYIHPAYTPKEIGLSERAAFLKVKEFHIGSKDIPGFIRLNSPEYRPQLHTVSFNATKKRGRQGEFTSVDQIGVPGSYQYSGYLVCSGNMMESGRSGQKTPRKNHVIVLEKDAKAQQIRIPDQVIEDYKNSLTPFLREELKDWNTNGMGCLGKDNPVFYVTNGDQVVQFGHCPNFRITARQQWGDATRASTPLDFVPKELRMAEEPDLADAIFGWVDEIEKGWGPKNQRAGRVFFTDAQFVSAKDGVWHSEEPIALHILSNPKPTTFQHYLVQDATKNHNPDDKSSLAHYGRSLDETQIRGFKRYWFKGEKPDIEANVKDYDKPKQLTQVIPVKPGVILQFRIHFENLRGAELGALLWALCIPGDTEKTYRHQLGMGKPLGMGVVAITPKLHLTERATRYSSLFDGSLSNWETGVLPTNQADVDRYISEFEELLRSNSILIAGQRLAETERIRQLLTMMEWREGDSNQFSWMRYMEIEREEGQREKVNEYKERPVLPTPDGVVALVGDKIPQNYFQQSPSTSEKRAQPSKSGSKLSADSSVSLQGLPGRLELVKGIVTFIEDNGDIYFELERAPEGILGRVKKSHLAGKQYREGSAISALVLNTVNESGEAIVDSEPPGISEFQGVVSSFGDGGRSFGFIRIEGRTQELFVHQKQLRGPQTLNKGQKVKFKIGLGMKGPEAKDVYLAELE